MSEIYLPYYLTDGYPRIKESELLVYMDMAEPEPKKIRVELDDRNLDTDL